MFGCASPKSPSGCTRCSDLEAEVDSLHGEFFSLGLRIRELEGNIHSVAREQTRMRVDFDSDVERVMLDRGWLPPEDDHQHDDRCEHGH